MTDTDWDHALGGTHALVWNAGALVAHGAVVRRSLLHHDRSLGAGYIEAVAVRADLRRRGYGAAVMTALEGIVRSAYDLGALSASEDGARLYAVRGWKAWRGRTWALTPDGVIRTPEDDEDVYVLEVSVPLDVRGDLTCDWREGDLW